MFKKLKKGFTLVELMIVVAIIGILAAIAIPNFIKFQARGKQSEAKTNLKGLFQAEKSYFAERDTFAADMQSIGFIPERGNRYAYALAATPTSWQQRRVATLDSANTNPDAIEVDSFKIVGAVSQPASDTTNATFTVEGGSTIPAGFPGVYTGSSGSFVGWAGGTVDNDADLDHWWVGGTVTIGIAASNCSETGGYPSGTPANSYNDVSCP
ncbi:MAG: prepilin-type N-terminal cleavage/methylation domain-containing protein [Myxococcota bacterium]